jgi:putative transposase
VHLRYARWDLSAVDLIDARHGTVLCALYPIDKAPTPAGGAARSPAMSTAPPVPTESGIAPLLRAADGRVRRHRSAARRTCPRPNRNRDP